MLNLTGNDLLKFEFQVLICFKQFVTCCLVQLLFASFGMNRHLLYFVLTVHINLFLPPNLLNLLHLQLFPVSPSFFVQNLPIHTPEKCLNLHICWGMRVGPEYSVILVLPNLSCTDSNLAMLYLFTATEYC